MGKVVLDAQMREKLNGLNEKMELYDESGNLLGYFIPPSAESSRSTSWGPFTQDQVEAAFRQSGPGRALDDILAELRRR